MPNAQRGHPFRFRTPRGAYQGCTRDGACAPSPCLQGRIAGAGSTSRIYFVILNLLRSEPIAPNAEFSASEEGAYQYFPLSEAQVS